MTFSFDSRPVQTIVNEIKNKGKQGSIDLQPSYQRGYVWSDDFKDKLIYSIIRQYPIGNISLRLTNEGIKEVVDGQQRLTTIYNFINNEYEIKGEYSKKIIEYIVDYMDTDDDKDLNKLKKRLRNKTGVRLKFDQLPEVIKQNINAYNISITNIMNASNEEIREFFRFLQNQERLKAGEIINSFPATELEVYLDKVSDLDLFLEKISFSSNERRDFDKHFYSIIGLISGNINYGVTDRVVIDFALNSHSEEFKNKDLLDNLIRNMNIITENESISKNMLTSSNVRVTKYLLLLCAFNLVDFSEDGDKKLKKLDEINIKLSAFNSAKLDILSTTFEGYSEEVIEEFRLITLLSKGSHNYNRVKNRMEILSYYVNNFDRDCRRRPSKIRPI